MNCANYIPSSSFGDKVALFFVLALAFGVLAVFAAIMNARQANLAECELKRAVDKAANAKETDITITVKHPETISRKEVARRVRELVGTMTGYEVESINISGELK